MKSYVVASVILLRADGAALLQLRDNIPGLSRAGRWVMPGGHSDPGEAVAMTARRELREETGYDSDALKWLAPFEDPEHPECDGNMFWGRYDGCQTVQCLEGQAVKFVHRNEADDYQLPGFLVELWDRALEAAQKP